MTNIWPMVPLGQVIQQRKEFTQINDLEAYKRCRVQLHAQGIVLRDTVPGAEIKTKSQQVCRAGEFLVAEIDAKVGGFGVVPTDLDGAIVSSHYFLFRVDDAALDRRFLGYFIRTPAFRDQVSARGTTNYAAIRPDNVLGYTVPLPPLDEQRRIVARIEALAAKIKEARGLRQKAVEEADALMRAALAQVFTSNGGKVPLNKASTFQRGRFAHRPRTEPRFYDGIYPFIQINDIPKDHKFITTHSQSLNDEGLKISKMFPSGTLVISIAATIGAVGILAFDSCMPDSLVGIVADETKTTKDYLYYFLRYEQSHLADIAPASAQKNINIRILNDVKLPLPSLSDQQRIVAYLDGLQAQVDALKHLQAATAAELDALLPSVLDKAFKGEL